MAERDRHLDGLELDALRAGRPIDPAVAQHAAACAKCQSALAGSLATLHRPAVEAAPSRDGARLLWAARAPAARRGKRGWRRWAASPGTWAVAAAAVLALAAVFVARRAARAPHQWVQGAPAPAARSVAPPPADLDGDGRITVLDALALSRRLHAEGRDDPDAIDAVLATAVSLGGK